VGLFKQNMKPYISYNGSKGILKHIVGCSLFPTMGTMKKMDLLKDLKVGHKCNETF
jgi:hypothetical protein